MKYHNLHRLCGNEQGAIALIWAIMLPVAVGFIGLGVDVGFWYASKRDLQNAVDAASIAAAYDISGSSPQSSTMLTTATYELARNGYSASDKVVLTVHYPPTSGAYTGSTQSVQVVAAQLQVRLFSKMFLADDPAANVSATATRQPIGSACVLALSQTANNAAYFQGSTTVNLNGCSVASNSYASDAIAISGSSSLSTYSLYTSGRVFQSGSSHLTTTESAVTNGTQLADPFANVAIPSYSGCNKSNYSINAAATISPGVYCNGMDFKSKAVVAMNPGVYIIDRGSFNAAAGAKITGNGVTIILTSSTGSSYSTITVNGGATVTLSAMTTGSTSGLLFYQDRRAPIATNSNKINGNSTSSYTGALYFPKQELQFSGNSSTNGGSCTKIVANTITFIGNSYLTNTCPASVATVNTQGLVTLVE